jgi:acylphosphatase
MPDQPVRRRIVLSGQVQGVFFRDSCRRQARSAGVTGWVRNTSDGRVEAVFEGDPDSVDRLVDWARQGPGRAQVRDYEVHEEPPEGLSGFEVR